MEATRHLRDIKLLLAILVAASLLGGYVLLQSWVNDTNADTERSTQQLRDSAAGSLPD